MSLRDGEQIGLQLKSNPVRYLPQAIREIAHELNIRRSAGLPVTVTRVGSKDLDDLPYGTVEVQIEILPADPNVPFPRLIAEIDDWRYIRYPIQEGEWGNLYACDYPLSFNSGRNGTRPMEGRRSPTMGPYKFRPIDRDTSAKDMPWTDPVSRDALQIYGEKDGVITMNVVDKTSSYSWLKDKSITLAVVEKSDEKEPDPSKGQAKTTYSQDDGAISLTVGEMSSVKISKSSVEMKVGSSSIKVEDGTVSINGTLMLNNEPYLSHRHPVTSAPGTSGTVEQG